ncbi:MAG: glycosyltransferase family 4 protein [Ardenticatenaceae bacterium]|nr:glycosyltransferase family 4 protein [Ardenticatenaceae bacterium]MCB8987058.1 glycosyltransferase family 4 protein [Ardenticatenaceae bacterium]
MNRYVLDARTATDHFPGIGRYVSNLARALPPVLASDERLILLRDPTRPSRWQLPAPSAQVEWVETAVSPFSLSQQWQIPKLLREIGADLYHSPYYLMPYRTGIPTLLTFYDLIPQRFPQYVSPRARLLTSLLTRLALRAADQVVAISQFTRKDALAAYPLAAEKVTAVPLAADPHFQPQPAAEIDRIRTTYQLPPTYALYLGINKPHKNLVNLLLAWNMLTEQLPEAPPLVIAGAWDKRYPEAKETAAALNLTSHITFLGPVAEEDLPGLYSGAELFVFPSQYEGFGLPVIEAMACGTAVACARTSSLPEVGGEAAAYFDPTQPEEITAVLHHLLTDNAARERRRTLGQKQAQLFSWEKTAVETLALYRQLTAHH